MLGHGALGEFALGETESESGNTISPASIDSAEAFGSPIVSGNVAIFPVAIASAEAFGVPSVVLVLSPASIASAEAFGSPEAWELVVYKPVSKIK